MMTVVPRVVLGPPSSGHGTALALSLPAALADRGLDVAGSEVGPDQVDAAAGASA